MIGVLGRKGFINIHAKTGGIARVHHSTGKAIGMRKDTVGLIRMAHIFLDAKIVDAQIKMQRGSHAHGTQIGRAMRSRPDLIKLCQTGDLPQV